jgi:hypothetical protein
MELELDSEIELVYLEAEVEAEVDAEGEAEGGEYAE